MKNIARLTGAATAFLTGLAVAAEKSDFSIISLHSGMSGYVDITQRETMLVVIGLAALGAAIAYRLLRRKQPAHR